MGLEGGGRGRPMFEVLGRYLKSSDDGVQH
jgi:hypothetical protein